MAREATNLYTIPANFAEEGTMFSGRVRTRNFIEAVVFLAAATQPLRLLDADMRTKIYIGVIAILPIALLALIGIQGESVSSFAFGFLKFIKNRRVLGTPDVKYRLNHERKTRKLLKKGRWNEVGGRKGIKAAPEGGKEGRQANGEGVKAAGG